MDADMRICHVAILKSNVETLEPWNLGTLGLVASAALTFVVPCNCNCLPYLDTTYLATYISSQYFGLVIQSPLLALSPRSISCPAAAAAERVSRAALRL